MLTCTHTCTQPCFSTLTYWMSMEWTWRWLYLTVSAGFLCMSVHSFFFLHQIDRELNCISWKCQDQSVNTAGMSRSIRGDASQCGVVGSLHLSCFTNPTIATTLSEMLSWDPELEGINLLHFCIHVCASFRVHSNTSTSRQVHGKLLAPSADKATSDTRMTELMGEKGGEGDKTA